MAKRVKFPLDMGNDIKVRSIEELKENYNAEKVTEYFLNGKLLTWLEDRRYDEEAEQVRKLSEMPDKEKAVEKLPDVFKVEIKKDVNIEALEIRQEKLKKLRDITSDDEILANVDYVAFSQEELNNLLCDGEKVIYLCGKFFCVPLNMKNIKYIGVNNPTVEITGIDNTNINLEVNEIVIEKCILPKEVEEKINSQHKINVYLLDQQKKYSGGVFFKLAAEYANEKIYIGFGCPKTIDFGSNDVAVFYSYDEGKSVNVLKDSRVYLITWMFDRKHSGSEILRDDAIEALKMLPKLFEQKGGIVDVEDKENIAAVDKAVNAFIKTLSHPYYLSRDKV